MKLVNPVNLIVINENEQILLCRRSENDEAQANTWSIPGGCAKEGEEFEKALHREIKEELGCRIKELSYFSSYYFVVDKTKAARAVYFYGSITGNIKLNHELFEFDWFDLDNPELFQLNLAFNQKNVIKDFVGFWRTLRD